MGPKENLHRIVIVPAGFNPKKYSTFDRLVEKASHIVGGRMFGNTLSKLFGYARGKIVARNLTVRLSYAEELIDNTNKSALVLDPQSGRQTIEYVLDALDSIDNTHVIIVGDKPSLEDIISKSERKSVHEVMQQGKRFFENLEIGISIWNELYYELKEGGYDVSHQKYFLFGDAFGATKENIETVMERIEERDADLSFGYCAKDGDNEKRAYFNIRPWIKLKDTFLRNSNFGAVKHQENDDPKKIAVPEYSYSIITRGYNLRKLKDYTNYFKSPLKVLPIAMRYYLSKLPLLKRYQYSLGSFKERIIRSLTKKDESFDFEFIKVPAELEMDIDSVKDIKRARKMIALEGMPEKTPEDCTTLYGLCKNIGCRHVKMISHKVKRENIQSFYEQIINGGDYYRSSDYQTDGFKAIYYDLERAYQKRFEKNRIRAISNVEKAFNLSSPYQWNSSSNRMEGFPIDGAGANDLLYQDNFFQSLIRFGQEGKIHPKIIKRIKKNIRQINKLEEQASDNLCNPKAADELVRKYCLS